MRAGMRGPVTTTGRGWLTAPILAALTLVLPAGASAATGDVTFGGCVANAGAHGCVDPPVDSLDGVRGVAVSPDSADVYTAAWPDQAASSFDRGAGGALAFRNCLAYPLGGSSCTDLPINSGFGPYGITVSPGGEDVYVVDELDDSITHYLRLAGGSLSFNGCIANAGADGCTDPSLDPLTGAKGVAVSPDGLSVYVTARTDDSLTHFTRLPSGGLVFASCVANGGAHGCVDPPQDSLNGAAGVVVSPDGEDVYVAADESDAVSHFTRAPTGAIVYAGCIAEAGAGGCADPPADSLNGAEGLAISPDGQSVYATAANDSSVTTFTRAANGTLGFAACVADTGLSGCEDPAQDSLGLARDVTVSADGLSVYVASIADASLTHFRRAAGGAITPAGCIADGGVAGCVDPPLDPLGSAADVAVTPDGTSVYVAGALDDAVTWFNREPASVTPGDTTPPETTITKGPKKKVKTKKKKAKVKFELASSEAGSTFTCRLDKKPFAPCSAQLTLKAKKGKHVFEAIATDPAGNADATAAQRKFKVKRKRR